MLNTPLLSVRGALRPDRERTPRPGSEADDAPPPRPQLLGDLRLLPQHPVELLEVDGAAAVVVERREEGVEVGGRDRLEAELAAVKRRDAL